MSRICRYHSSRTLLWLLHLPSPLRLMFMTVSSAYTISRGDFTKISYILYFNQTSRAAKSLIKNNKGARKLEILLKVPGR